VVSRRAIAGALVLGLVLAAGSVAAPADEAASAWHTEMWNGLMSPFCPGRALIDCPSEQAAELRAWIAAQESAGRSREEVEQQLYQQYGDVILQAPRARGFGLAAYVIPVLAFAAGGALVWAFLRRQSRGGAARGPGGAPVELVDPELERRIDEELRG
jgi:cytochrome c-type biogenesis protein CcmH